MKFRKESTASPKMELLSRRSSTSKLTTFKRTKSFRASVRLMSKIRNHTNLNLNQISSPVSVPPKGAEAKISHWSLPFLQKKVEPSEGSKKTEEIPQKSRAREMTDDKSEIPDIEIGASTESSKIAKDLKQKLSLANRIMGRHRKGSQDGDKVADKHESRESSKSASSELLREVQLQDSEQLSGKRVYPIHPAGEHNSYENPTFCLDSSIDSSVSTFFHEVQPGDLDADVELSLKKDSNKENSSEVKNINSKKVEVLTIVVDSEKVNETLSANNEALSANNDLNMASRHSKNNKSLRRYCRVRTDSRKIGETKYDNYQRIVEEDEGEKAFSISGVVLRSSMNKLDEAGSSTRCESRGVKEPLCEKVSANSSKFLRPRTVDNIANFWNGSRSSFRVKGTSRKKASQEPKDLESDSHDLVLVTTTSGSSRFLSPCKKWRSAPSF